MSQTTAVREQPDKNRAKVHRPLHVIRSGAIAASIWRRQTPTGFEYLDFSLSRSWKLKNGEREGYSQNFFEKHAETLAAVVQAAAEYIRSFQEEPGMAGAVETSRAATRGRAASGEPARGLQDRNGAAA